jgi:hypothetical protein
MEEFLGILQQYGPYIGLPVIISYIVQKLKIYVKFFRNHHIGVRLLPVIPLILGICGGFLLPLESWKDSILIGGGLGALSNVLYKAVTVTFAKTSAIVDKEGLSSED